MALNARTYKDLNLNLTLHPIKKDITPLTDADAVNASLRNLILCRPYERPFHPEYSSAVAQLLFENATPLTANLIQRSITDVINNFEKRVQLLSVNVVASHQLDAYTAKITYRLVNTPDPITFDLFLERLR